VSHHRLYRYSANVRVTEEHSPCGTPYIEPIIIQVGAYSMVEATHIAAAIGKQLGLLLIGPL